MRRREFVAIAAGAVLPFAVRAQHHNVDRARIGLLSLHEAEIEKAGHIGASAFRSGMHSLGYNEGRDYELFERNADGAVPRLGPLANDLIGERVDVIVALGTDATHAARQATSTRPIVMAGVGDPVRSGFVTSLARPGGNITGTALATEDTAVKQLEILKEAAPRVKQVAILRRPIGGHDRMIKSLKAAEVALRLVISDFVITAPHDLEGGLEQVRRSGADGIVSLPSPLLDDLRWQIADFAMRYQLPVAGWQPLHSQAGFLVSYGPNLSEMHSRSASYVVRILKGARPADLPVEQPERFQLTINLKTANALGLTIPPTLLARADEVIE